ncbi:MAG: hypothetical protein Q7S40_02840, partial [Opitutaceae bacterium]|nr:hypothetical protein [Opitutaceae bacterium]
MKSETRCEQVNFSKPMRPRMTRINTDKTNSHPCSSVRSVVELNCHASEAQLPTRHNSGFVILRLGEESSTTLAAGRATGFFGGPQNDS